jgi:cell division protein FtsQ
MRRALFIGGILLVIIYVIVMIGFVSGRKKQVVCNNLQVRVLDSIEHRFVSSKDILQLIGFDQRKFVGGLSVSINTYDLETLIYRHPAVKDARVFKTIGGRLVIEVTQRQPILRVINRNGQSYYIDEDGKAMPWSDRFTARVLVANGYINQQFDFRKYRELNIQQPDSLKPTILSELYQLAKFIQSDEFWNANIEQVYVNPAGDFELIPRVGAHLIIFGDNERMEEKFENLRAMYEVGLPNAGWNTYETINLKYRNQVVCTKK